MQQNTKQQKESTDILNNINEYHKFYAEWKKGRPKKLCNALLHLYEILVQTKPNLGDRNQIMVALGIQS